VIHKTASQFLRSVIKMSSNHRARMKWRRGDLLHHCKTVKNKFNAPKNIFQPVLLNATRAPDACLSI
jgi:hypothetical protein